ncbi:nucleoside recognition domain-containing protein [Paenibacillus thermotolerans]|uniref:nucleoside recognition domain-containing protein n=1 Tax=Paenibacillus thermotolerans TaxID=3027807 RepID=UPI002367B311|nr:MULTISPECIES: nucleoside recognition domain-containing protein [unclassified Paenibacillus]
MGYRRRGTPWLAYIAVITALLILLFPMDSFRAAVQGVAIWWDVLFPALFPFFVVSELMLGFGIVHFFGTLLDPMMRPVFRVPGPGGFVMAMGFASGYPVGARLTSQLWDAKLVNREESERLAAFTTTSDPIFLIGAVSIGFFHNAALAPVLAVAHYGGAVALGLLMRYWGGNSAPFAVAASGVEEGRRPGGSIWRRAFAAMHQARMQDGRSLGTLLREGVQTGIRLIIVVGGLVVFFSVVIKVLTLAGVVSVIQSMVGFILSLFGISAPLSAAIVNGFFEVTLGAKSAGAPFPGAQLQAQAAVAAFILSWAGLSVHAQSMSLMHHMPVRYSSFVLARLVHAFISAFIAFFAWDALLPAEGVWLPDGASVSGWEAFRVFAPLSATLFIGTIFLIPVLFIVYTAVRPLWKLISR